MASEGPGWMVPGGSTPGSGQPWGPGAEATSGKHLTSYCVQITIHVISSFRQQIEEGKRHFHSALCGGKVSQKLWVERPKLHTYYSFQAEECFAYFLWGREYSDFSGDVDAASCSSSCWLRGRDQRERRFVGGKKASRGFDSAPRFGWRLQRDYVHLVQVTEEARLVCSFIAIFGA